MEQKEIPSNPYGVRRNRSLIVRQRDLTVRAVGVRPQSGSGIFRFLHYGSICQSAVYTMLEHQNGIFCGFGICGKEAADLSRTFSLTPSLCHLLGILCTYDMVCRKKQDQEDQE